MGSWSAPSWASEMMRRDSSETETENFDQVRKSPRLFQAALAVLPT